MRAQGLPHHARSDAGCTQIANHVALRKLGGMQGKHHLHGLGSLMTNRPHIKVRGAEAQGLEIAANEIGDGASVQEWMLG